MIDPGHGGKDPGACGQGLQEKNLTLNMAKLLRTYLLNNYKCQVALTRETDVFMGLSDRARKANAWKANYFISLHINAGGGAGYEDFIYTKLSDTGTTAKIRNAVHSKVAKVWIDANRPNRGKKKANFAVLRETSMPAVLLENGFIDNMIDVILLKQKPFVDKLIKAMGDGIALGLNLPVILKVTPDPKPITPPKKEPVAKPKAEYDVRDVIKTQQSIVNLIKLTEEEVKKLDINKDGKIDVKDVIMILQRIVGSL